MQMFDIFIFISQTNIGFLVMTIVITCRHFKKQDKKNNIASARYVLMVLAAVGFPLYTLTSWLLYSRHAGSTVLFGL